MKYKTEVDAEDYARLHLYHIAKSRADKEQRWLNLLYPILILSLLAIVLIRDGKNTIGILVLGVAGIYLIAFPLYLKWYNKRYFIKVGEELYREFENKISVIELTEETIRNTDEMGILEYKISFIDMFIEVRQNLFIKFKNGVVFIFSKKSSDYKELAFELKKISDEKHIIWSSAVKWDI